MSVIVRVRVSSFVLRVRVREGCRPPLFQRVVARIHDVNTVTNDGLTALMYAAWLNQLAHKFKCFL